MTREFKIRQVYLKDASFQAPMGAAGFNQEWSPTVQVDLKIETEALGTDLHEVALRLSVVSRTGASTHFMVEVVQAGAFGISGYDAGQLHQILRTVCAETLYPYAREAIDNLIVRGRFPALLLKPIDFAANYAAK